MAHEDGLKISVSKDKKRKCNTYFYLTRSNHPPPPQKVKKYTF
jgi:hypothetical protein